MATVNEKMTAIADEIRECTGGTEPLTLDAMAQEIPNVYNAGYEKGKAEGGGETEDFWGQLQNYGKRTIYTNVFAPAAFVVLNPKYGLDNATGCGNLLYNNTVTTEVHLGNATKCTNWDYAFAYATALKYIYGHITLKNSPKSPIVGSNKLISLESIDASNITSKLDLSNNTLQEIRFVGTIPKSITFSSNNLSHDSLMSIINALTDYSEDTSGTTYTLKIGSTNIAKLSDDEKDIAYQKGWNLS